ncbi:GNAT family N-acetyltransferase [Brevibacterium oceani]|uniref:GNAT family N-acetyltransferase n=1 Tax=Brevibacterium oceani TaxID=358099 RepID=UPI0015E72775|nr:GNAT family N-acetyltransferase [Brevibacterium oceani]
MDEPKIHLELLTTITDEDADSLSALLKQLSSTAAFDRARFQAGLEHDGVDVLAARSRGRIVGMATFVDIPLPTGRRGHVEDVVVHEEMRGRGIARMLLQRMTMMAAEREMRSLDLTSRPSRESAIRLYESIGFVRRETNVLRFTPEH